MVPNSAKPNPSDCHAPIAIASLSIPAASPIGFETSKPHSETRNSGGSEATGNGGIIESIARVR